MKRIYLWIAIAALAALAGVGLAWSRLSAAPSLGPGYSAVLLTNNQVYFGKLSGLGTAFPVLTNVYYVQTGVDSQTRETRSVLLKRGKEWHGPDRMVLNADHIVLVEPVTPSSKVAELIAAGK